MGNPNDFSNFINAVINKQAFTKIAEFIEHAKNSADAKIICGGECDDSVGYYIKPTIINILFGLALIFGRFFTHEPVLKKLMGRSISLTNEGWEVLNKRWIYFFFGLAILNELVWRTQSEEFWVNFKVWGLLPITFIFTAFQIGLINKYKTNE